MYRCIPCLRNSIQALHGDYVTRALRWPLFTLAVENWPRTATSGWGSRRAGCKRFAPKSACSLTKNPAGQGTSVLVGVGQFEPPSASFYSEVVCWAKKYKLTFSTCRAGSFLLCSVEVPATALRLLLGSKTPWGSKKDERVWGFGSLRSYQDGGKPGGTSEPTTSAGGNQGAWQQHQGHIGLELLGHGQKETPGASYDSEIEAMSSHKYQEHLL